MNILLSGGGGRLGTELRRLVPEIIAPDQEEWDITKPDDCIAILKKYRPDVVVHAAAYTDVAGAEKEKSICRKVNVEGTACIVNAIKDASPESHLIYISTDYVFSGDKGNYKEDDVTAPVNFYAQTKLDGEKEVEKAPHYHIIRTSFKPRPFIHPKAVKDMWTSADYVDVIAREIALAIRNYKLLPEIIHIATVRKSIFDLAKVSNPKVEPILRSDIKNVTLPKDTSLDISVWQELKKQF